MKRITALSRDQSRPAVAPFQRYGIVPEIPPDKGWLTCGLPRSRHLDDRATLNVCRRCLGVRPKRRIGLIGQSYLTQRIKYNKGWFKVLDDRAQPV